MSNTALTADADFQLVNTTFPRIGKMLDLAWGFKDFPPYINALINNPPQEYTRQGFPHDVLTALMKLQQWHDREFPELKLEDAEVWTMSSYSGLGTKF